MWRESWAPLQQRFPGLLLEPGSEPENDSSAPLPFQSHGGFNLSFLHEGDFQSMGQSLGNLKACEVKGTA